LLSEKILNNIGNTQLREGHTEKAITVFNLNIAMYPGVYTTYESLGEAYMNAGNKQLAIKNYEES
jgi:tetratricopeptide (TPR) repeat protein